jgi:hypothetical protein
MAAAVAALGSGVSPIILRWLTGLSAVFLLEQAIEIITVFGRIGFIGRDHRLGQAAERAGAKSIETCAAGCWARYALPTLQELQERPKLRSPPFSCARWHHERVPGR